MTTQENNMHGNELPNALRWQLRAMRRDEPPANDLWPAIAARLQQQSTPVTQNKPRRWIAPLAMAATLILAIGSVGLLQRSDPAQQTQMEGESLVQREADGMTRQYQAAMLEFATIPAANTMQSEFELLDRNATLIIEALAQDPDSRLLLEQLRRTYARRLALTQRLAYT